MLILICAIDDPVTVSRIEELFLRTKDGLLAYAQSIVQEEHLAEDIVQSAFKIIIARPHLLKYEEAIKNKAYMTVIVRNLALNYLRDHKKEIPDIIDRPADIPNPDEVLIQEESLLYAKEIIAQLPKNYQDAIFLKYEMDYSNVEISELLGISYDNVRQRVSRGLSKVRKSFEKRGVNCG